jgi:hypothetical protein
VAEFRVSFDGRIQVLPDTSDRVLSEVVALADQRRRAQGAVRSLVRLAPALAGIGLLAAVLARVLRFSTAVPLVVLGAAGLGLALTTWIRSRRRQSTDAIAAAVDADAALRGELRSAHWFEAAEGGDEWTRFHLERAADRARAIDWNSLYPPVRGGKSWAATAVLATTAIVLSVGAPGRYLARAVGVADQPASSPEALSAELEAKLKALLGSMEAGEIDAEAARATLEELKELMAKIDPALQKKLAEMMKNAPPGQDGAKNLDKNSLAEKGAKGDKSQGVMPDDVKWALEDLAAKLASAEKNRPNNPNSQESSSETGEKGAPSDQMNKSADAASAQASMQMVREAATDPGAAKMMMGGGMMGGDSRPGQGGNNGAQNGADALLFAQALRKELIEASADMQGQNVKKEEDIRRKTEQGKSTLGFSRVAPGAFERSRADAPPAVPEARRPLVQRYFIRK